MKKLSTIIVLFSLALAFTITVDQFRPSLLFAGGPEKGYMSVYKNLTGKAVNRGRCTAFNKIGENLLASGSEVPARISFEIAEACGALGVDVNPGLVELSYCLTTSQINTPPFVIGVDPVPDGSSENPYRICSYEQFAYISTDPSIWDKHFVLEADIDLTGYTGVIGNVSPWFKGSISGNGHTLSNFSVNDPSLTYLGLIGVNGGRIANLSLTKVSLTGDDYVGAIAGINSGTIIDSYAEGSVEGQDRLGGITGQNNGFVDYSEADVDVSGNTYIGGLAGFNYYRSVISNSSAMGTVSGVYAVGGLVGYHALYNSPGNTGMIRDSYAIGDVTASGNFAGGLVGRAAGPITNSYALGNVSGDEWVGGLAGSFGNESSTMNNSHAEGIVTGNHRVGGLVGELAGAETVVTDCYATGNVVGTGGIAIGGLIGNSNGSPISYSYATGNVTSTAQMVGGLVGNDYQTYVEHSYATGDVSGTSYVGGLVGSGGSSDISWSYATGSVNGDGGSVGGLAGSNYSISFSYANGEVNNGVGVWACGGLVGSGNIITDSYATGNVNGSRGVGGLAGRAYTVTRAYATGIVSGDIGQVAGFAAGYVNPVPVNYTASFWNMELNPTLSDTRFPPPDDDLPGVYGVSTVILQTQATFTGQGWDFVGESGNGDNDYWTMPAGGGYPILNPPPSP